jgi:membrane associated rhomboid family serine protease
MSYRNFRPTGLGGFKFLPPAVKNLLIVNGLFFLATVVFDESVRISLIDILGLHYWTSPEFEIYQVVSHMFMHGGPMHLFSNMFALWMFGTALENVWGPKRMIFFYIFTALGAAFLHQTVLGIEYFQINSAFDAFKDSPTVENLVNTMNAIGAKVNTTYITYLESNYNKGVISAQEAANVSNQITGLINERLSIPTVGASGAVFGILIAFALYYPNTELFLLFLPIPIKAKYFVGIYAVMELYLGIQNNPGDNIAHFAHLGGALFGYILVKYWNKNNRKSFY